jgi:hypothetical protein
MRINQVNPYRVAEVSGISFSGNKTITVNSTQNEDGSVHSLLRIHVDGNEVYTQEYLFESVYVASATIAMWLADGDKTFQHFLG